jgi:hypothetical protein
VLDVFPLDKALHTVQALQNSRACGQRENSQ